MKIIFICASLEPGKDGVGDYTRKLAAFLSHTGNEVTIIALNDKYLQEGHLNECQEDEGSSITVLRFSYAYNWQLRRQEARAYMETFKPDWISLQYVPYGFHKKGLPFYLPGKLKAITKGYRCHIMFHEMWIGISRFSPLTHKIYGFFQQLICASLIKAISPEKITTSNRLYQLVLKDKHINAALLPLFSNISISPPDLNFLKKVEKENQVFFGDRTAFVLGVFGTLYPYAKLNIEIPTYISRLNTGKKIVLIFLGRNSHPEELEKLKKVLNSSVQIIELGGMDTVKVSSIFSVLNEAILCTPFEHIGKSGAYAALKYHDVKITVLSSQPVPKYEEEIKNYNLLLEQKEQVKWGVEYIAGNFARYLASGNKELKSL